MTNSTGEGSIRRLGVKSSQPFRGMPKEFKTVLEVPLPAEALWALRLDQGLDEHLADYEEQIFARLYMNEEPDDSGEVVIAQKIKLNFKQNPVPKALRGLLKDSDFSFKTKSSWYKHKHDEEHRLKFEVELPVLSKNISITGQQWLVPIDARRCQMHCLDLVTVNRIPGLCGMIEREIAKGMSESYQKFPARVMEYYSKTDNIPLTSVPLAAAEPLPEPRPSGGVAAAKAPRLRRPLPKPTRLLPPPRTGAATAPPPLPPLP